MLTRLLKRSVLVLKKKLHRFYGGYLSNNSNIAGNNLGGPKMQHAQVHNHLFINLTSFN